MKLISFSVTNYRSITKAHKIPIGDLTVLVGKNNEGKSNFLKALNIAMRTLSNANKSYYFSTRIDSLRYDWNRDFPISLQQRKVATDSIFRLEFELDTAERQEFKNEVRSSINSTLPIEIKYGRTNKPSIHIPKKGHGSNTLSSKSKEISAYIEKRIDFNYIPAIRTEEEATAVVREMLSKELSYLEEDPTYQQALEQIAKLQQPILDKVGNSIKNSLKQFLPNIKDVSIKIPYSSRNSALRNQCEIEIDDGTKTLLEFKGDGVKSLSALGLLKDKKRGHGTSLIAIEEPEAHLHPSAMHSLSEVINSLTSDNQVVITTHCPIFVDRNRVSRNVLIDSQKAKQAKDISEVREILGVKSSDNLINANHVLLVEGETDQIILTSLLSHLSVKIQKAIKGNQLVIQSLRGTRNLTYTVNHLISCICNVHIFLDNDTAGNEAIKKAVNEGLINQTNITLTNCKGLKESEIEDCIDPGCYAALIFENFGVYLDRPEFKSKQKWTNRMNLSFKAQGKYWDDDVEKELKYLVADAVKLNFSNALCQYKGGAICQLVDTLERLL